ncbi:MAG: penicillin-binding transpeptidase domain-containing protein [Propionibacteriaceae bacterium]
MLRRRQPHSRARSSQPGLRLAAVGLALLLTACTAKGGAPDPTTDPEKPDQAVAALAAALTKRDVSPVVFAGAGGAEIQAQLKPLVSGMGSAKPAVTVGAIDTQGSQATAGLQYAWTFPGVTQKWTYDTSVQLVEEDGQWKTSWQPSILQPGLDGTNRLSEAREQGARGEILDADGDAIAKLRPVVRIGIDKTKVSGDKAAASAARLAALVDITTKTYVAKVAAAGSQDFVEAITFRSEDDDRPSRSSVYAIPGAVTLPGDQVLAPSREFARALIGTVGPASKEIVDDSAGALTAGDEVGRSGLQRRYDKQLRGTPGVTVRLVAAKPSASATASPSASPSPTPSASPSSAPAEPVFQAAAVAGKDLSTTLSIPVQELAEKTLAKTKPASALVAIRPSTGEIVAAANGPGSDDLAVATTGQYPPGSTFKVVSSLALLRAGLKPSSPVTCPATVTVNGKQFKNYSDYPSSQRGDIDLRTALAQSCNTAFIGQRGKLSGNELAQAAGSLGVGTDYDVGFPSFFGSVPADDTATGRAAAMIGQGKVLASPMAMAAVAASVSAGKTVVPHLIDGTTATSKAKPLTEDEARDLRAMMGAVVSEGSGGVLRDLEPPNVIAKTGTAEYGPKAPFKTHAWMIAAQGDLAVAVFVRTGSSGSRTAGPLLSDFLSGVR